MTTTVERLEETEANFTGLTKILWGYHREVGVLPLDVGKATMQILWHFQNGKVFAARVDGEIVASLAIKPELTWYSSVPILTSSWFYIVPEHRNGNIQKMLLREAKRYAGEIDQLLFISYENYRRAKGRGLVKELVGFMPIGYDLRVS